MKIGNLIEQLRTERPAAGSDRARAAAPAGGDAKVSDTVALSATSRQLAAGQAGGVSGDFDADKVASVRAAIAQGTFRVDAGRVADRMIDQAGEMLSLKSRN